MNEERAREILGDHIQKDNSLTSDSDYVFWVGKDTIIIDGHYSTDELEAFVWWMKNKTVF